MSDSRSRRYWRLALWMIVVPMAAAAIYFFLLASPRYVSTSQVVVRQAGSNVSAQQMPGLSLLLGGINPASREETIYLREFINSLDMLQVLEEKLNWRAHYSSQWNDPLYWISKDAPLEDLLKYYRRLVTVHFDEITGLLTIEVQALTPEFAKQTLDVILNESERFVNEISHRMARDQVKFAEEELIAARKSYEARREDMIKFQSANKVLDAQASAESRATILAELEGRLTTERANLRGLLGSLSASSPQVKQQKNIINALEKQLDQEKAKLISSADGDHLNVTAAKYRNLQVDFGIAEETYKISVAALENARIDARKKIRSLVTIVSPNMPQEAIYPRTLYNLLTMFIALALLYGITRFIIASIEDHRD